MHTAEMCVFIRLVRTVVESVTQRRWEDTSFAARAQDHSLRTLNRRYMSQSVIIVTVIFLLILRELS